MCCFEKDRLWTAMMDGFLYTNTYTHVTHDPSRPVDDSVPLHTSVPQDCLEAVWPGSGELSLKLCNHFLNQLLKTISSSGFCKMHTLPLAPSPLGATTPVALLGVWLRYTFSAQSPTLASSLELAVVACLPAWIPVPFGRGRGVIPSLGFLEYDTRISTLAWWSF